VCERGLAGVEREGGGAEALREGGGFGTKLGVERTGVCVCICIVYSSVPCRVKKEAAS
jgi:hypothetical protein